MSDTASSTRSDRNAARDILESRRSVSAAERGYRNHGLLDRQRREPLGRGKVCQRVNRVPKWPGDQSWQLARVPVLEWHDDAVGGEANGAVNG